MCKKKDIQNTFIVALIVSLLVFAVFFYISFKTSDYIYNKFGGYTNLYIYIFGVILFFSSFLWTYHFFSKREILHHFFINKLKIVSILFALGWCVTAFFYEKDIYPNNGSSYLRHNIPFILYIGIIVTAMSIFISLVKINIIFNNWKIVLFCVSLMAIVFALMYAPNIFNDSYNTVYHIHAYTNSIMNNLNLIPYDNVNCSIYGHYALFYYLPVKIISLFCKSELTAVIIVIAIIGCITYAMMFYCTRKLIKNDVIFCITALGFMQPITQVMSQGQYYQLYPHRIFFPALLLFVLTIEREKHFKFKNCLNWLLITLGFVWNVEIGMVCGIVMLAYQIYQEYRKSNKTIGILREFFYNGMYLIFTFFVSYILVNIYNLLVGGQRIDIKQYIYPIGSSVYNVSGLRLPIPNIFAGYFIVLICFLSIFIYTLYKKINITLQGGGVMNI